MTTTSRLLGWKLLEWVVDIDIPHRQVQAGLDLPQAQGPAAMTHTTITWTTLMLTIVIFVVLHIKTGMLTMMISYPVHNIMILTNAARNSTHLHIAKLVIPLLAAMKTPLHKDVTLKIHLQTIMRMPPLNTNNRVQDLRRGHVIGATIRRTTKMAVKSAMWRNAKIIMRKETRTNMSSMPTQTMLWIKRNLSAKGVIMMRNWRAKDVKLSSNKTLLIEILLMKVCSTTTHT